MHLYQPFYGIYFMLTWFNDRYDSDLPLSIKPLHKYWMERLSNLRYHNIKHLEFFGCCQAITSENIIQEHNEYSS